MPGERPRTSRPRFNNGTSNNLNRADESYRDISVQTGEEFSADFLRERVSHRAASADMDEQMKNGVGFIVGQNHELVYEDLSRILGIRRRDSDNAPEVSEFYQVQKNYDFAPEIRNHRDYRFNNDIQPRKKSFEIVFSPTGPPLHSSDSPSSQQPHYGLGVSDGSSSGKVKCLCSFGGKIIPRPSDGKLRYIGGETRIMSIRRNATFSELMKKTCAICNQLHTIRYQLPGEDLDALITVSSDNDLHLMIEEFRDLDKFSQRLRIFLISLNESDGGSSSSFEGKNLQPNEGDYHYMNAPNGMSSSRESLPSPSQLKIHELDSPDNPNLQMYDDHPFGGNFMYTNNQREYKNPYFDTTGYYYSNPVNNVPAMNYQNQNNFFAELELGHDLYPQNHVQGSEFPPLPLYGDFANDRPVHNCFTYFSTKSTFSEKKNDHFSGSDIPIEDCHEQSSDAQLQLDTTMSGLSQDLVMQKLETGDEKYQKGGESVNMLKFTMNNDQSMEYIDWGKTTINWMGKKESNDREGDEDIKANANIRSRENSRSGVRIVEQEREARKSSLNNAADQSPGMVGFEPFFTNQGNAIPFAEYESCLSLDWHENDRHMIDLSLPSSITAILGRKISNKVETEVKPTSKGSNFVEIRQSGDRKHVSLQKSTFNVEDVTHIVPHDVASSSKIVPYVHDGTSDGSTSPKGSETESETGSSISKEFNVEIAEVDGNGKEEAATPEVCIAEMEADFNNLQIIKNVDLEEQQELGSGTYGTVYHGKWRGTDVAIKRIRKSCFAGGPAEKERLIKDFWREANILSKLHHPNVLAFYGVVPDGPGGTLATVTEYMVNGSLRHVLLSKEHTLDRRKKLLIALDAAFGMEYLHMKNIVHFDLKCDNLLVNLRDPQRPICKVGDLGLSRIKHNTLISGGVRGTLPYMAPELLTGNSGRVSEKVDVFSFGIALWEILTGEEPYANMHCGAIIGGILSNKLRPTIPENCNPDWRKLMEECWSGNPTERPSFTEITNRLRAMTTSLQPKRHNFSKR